MSSPRLLAEVAVALGVAAGSLYAVVEAGEFALSVGRVSNPSPSDGLETLPTAGGELPFAAIECPVPAGVSRAHFLQEVQYLGAFPDRLPLGEAGLIDRLATAFRAHPAVREAADEVTLSNADDGVAAYLEKLVRTG